jgi:hypothetical protein
MFQRSAKKAGKNRENVGSHHRLRITNLKYFNAENAEGAEKS